ncbi:ABC transporter ATP-binding protein [Oceanobacillus kimchii]|uniref:Putative hemin import ATP-binding protein HrtA n=1 Tax=Oceanobacillus kimchii TaxID=746691 RepID=A0ABQ5TSC7_9BACI|nr:MULTISPECIES: ABC transporter ATP-binding protein [Oceanobacillus]MBT2599602.1 ABC transporter ATP-binding protein [Oceanobacillus sp. ISL-74]MCT1576788.1 ABC transporter ATP-binding protein [Oceanobacillus kimchii]MCT2134858.1 ABC transporter ATP-binding protein [Oceanobacillus kimchii]OEH56150.1 hemin ABC transporter ATP-binding protein [Oceanobacillus sp. E9]GLO67827.1 peptide ABC transporter ATP-binding protein [Oceanobacillus kimchii]
MTILQLKNVQKVFGSGHTKVEAMKQTDFEAKAGELIAVIGPSGSGKSTFLTIAGGLQTPSNGDVYINGTPITELNEKKRSKVRLKEVGFVLQASNLVPFLNIKQQMQLLDKVKKNNLKGEELEQLYTSLGIDHLLKNFPSDLSGGERQRVAIAKALYTNPSIILADEPTASLDSDRAFEVMRMLKEITKEKNTTTIVVTHDTRLIDDCDKVYQITDGKMELQSKLQPE